MSQGLDDRFAALWGRLGLRGDPAPVLDDLLRRYAEPHRAYHTLAHIQHCLHELDSARELAADPDLVEWGLWFDDAIYDTRADDSEARSRDLMLAVMTGAGADADQMARAARLVMATGHAAPAEGPDATLLVDVDLSILGQPQARFDAYEAEVRREYAWVPGLLFRRGRAKILKGSLARPAIYLTPPFHARYEQAARANLKRSLGRRA